MKRIYFSVISLLAVGVLVMACHKNTLEEDLPERYLLASEMRIISAHPLKINSSQAYDIGFHLSAEATERMESLQWKRLDERPVVTIIGEAENVEIPVMSSIESGVFYPCSFTLDFVIVEENAPMSVFIRTYADFLPTLLPILGLDEEDFQKAVTASAG
ncbi:MAG: hypothetical protein J5939_07500 [Bacteroidales bacterium]|nr:hypothetical protein [Bacteroidales bacterium]